MSLNSDNDAIPRTAMRMHPKTEFSKFLNVCCRRDLDRVDALATTPSTGMAGSNLHWHQAEAQRFDR
jgi:hypothetical protein